MPGYDPNEPRDRGKWTTGGGGATSPGHGYSVDAHLRHGIIYTSNVHDAVRALYENRKVELDQPREVATMLNELGQVSKTFIQLGKDAPNFNLCNVSVADTNLFCAQSQGIARIQMPQLTDPKKFREYLESKGVKVTNEKEKASHLRASQNELVGAKVAAIAHKMETGKLDPKDDRLFISRDNYIVDGHHRWAGAIGLDAMNNKFGDIKMKVARVDMNIIPLLKEANKFSGPRKSGTGTATTIHGTTLSGWASHIAGIDINHIDKAIRSGLIGGLDNTEIARRVVGSATLNGIDGTTAITRHHISQLARAEIKPRILRKRKPPK